MSKSYSILSDREITNLALDKAMIVPFVSHNVHVEDSYPDGESAVKWRKVLSYGVTSYGYDLRLSAKDFRIFSKKAGAVVDPKAIDEACREQLRAGCGY